MQGLQINKLQKLARFISKKSPLIHILINFILPGLEIVTMKFRYEVPSYAFRFFALLRMTLKKYNWGLGNPTQISRRRNKNMRRRKSFLRRQNLSS